MKRLSAAWALTIMSCIPARGLCAPDIAVSPTTRDFGSVSTAALPAATTVTIKNVGTGSATVQGLSEAGTGCVEFDESASFPVTLTGGQSVIVDITFGPVTRGQHSCSVTVIDSDSDVDTFSLTGTGTASLLAVTDPLPPNPLHFDDQQWAGGAGQTLHVMIRNDGNEPIEASNFSATLATGADFSVGSFALPIAVGASALVPITFNPASAGDKADTLTIALNNDLPSDPNGVVRLTGTGTANAGIGPETGSGLLRLVGPNPVTSSTTFVYTTPSRGMVRLELFDTAGRLVRPIVDRMEDVGTHVIAWSQGSSQALPTGLYLIRLSVGGRTVGTHHVVVLQ